MYAAVADGEVDVISAYSSDGRIAQTTSSCSTIPRARSRPMTRCCCWRRSAPATLRCATRWRRCMGRIRIEAMRAANLRAAQGGSDSSPGAVARWLWEHVAGTDARR